MSDLPGTLGVVGAGTMGSGIAQLGCAAGMRTVLHDPVPEALKRGIEQARAGLARWAEKGHVLGGGEPDGGAARPGGYPVGPEAAELLEAAPSIEGLAGCDLVIEAAPERADLKRGLLTELSRVCGPDAVLATNTSSIPVTSLAGAAARPENVVGMHFFNPAPLMRLLELVRADQTGERALALARSTGAAMGKRVIVAADGPGFVVNRCGRPFYTEALRLLGERVADHEQIDRICRLGGGFRMGPFELMDLVGIDVGLAVARSFTELSFGEPRWRPSPIQARMVAAGRLGRKTGRGYYDYGGEASHRPEDPPPAAVDPGAGAGQTVAIEGEGALARELREHAASAGFAVTATGAAGDPPDLTVHADLSLERASAGAPTAHLAAQARAPGARDTADADGPPSVVLCADRSLAASGAPRAVGFHLLAPLAGARLVELTRLPATPDASAAAAADFFGALGLRAEWVADAPGLVLGRIVCQLVNEAAFAVGEGAGSAADVDDGLELGLNHPRGPVAWGEAIGLDHVLATVDGLWAERREERYRAAPALRRAVAFGTGLRG